MDEAFLKKLQLNIDQPPLQEQPAANSVEIKPKPEFCVKTKNGLHSKIFLNICSCDLISQPKIIPEDQLCKIVEDPDSHPPYRVPMSIGDLHTEIDRVGAGCTACDIVVHPALIDKMKTSPLYHSFFIGLCLQGVQHKYSMDSLSSDCVILKNKKYLGTMPAHFIRTTSKPAIIDMSENSAAYSLVNQPNDSKSFVKVVEAERPAFEIVQAPPKGHPEFLVAEVQMPKLKSSRGIELDIGEDRLVIRTDTNTYTLDIFLPFAMIADNAIAQFNRITRILTITIPVAPQ